MKRTIKNFWFWLIPVTIILVSFGFSKLDKDQEIISHVENEKHDIFSDKKVSGNSKSSSSNINNKKDISDSLIINDKKIKILDKKDYNLSVKDKSWDAADIGVNKTTVYRMDEFNYEDASGFKTAAEGLIVIRLIFEPSRDIESYPEQGLLITNEGQQIDRTLMQINVSGYKEYFTGEILKGVRQERYVVFPVEKLSSVSKITKLRLKFNSHYDGTYPKAFYKNDMNIVLKQ